MSNPVLPYVYKCTHKQSGQFYIGFRKANRVSATEDLGVYYFTSSKYVKPIFNEFNYEIIAEFFDVDSAFNFEQELIRNEWRNPFILNRNLSSKTKKKYKSNDKGKFAVLNIQTNRMYLTEKEEYIKNKNLVIVGSNYYIINNKAFRSTDANEYLFSNGYTKGANNFYYLKESTKQKYVNSFERVILFDKGPRKKPKKRITDPHAFLLREIENIKNYQFTSVEKLIIHINDLFKTGLTAREIGELLNLSMRLIYKYNTVSLEDKLKFHIKQEKGVNYKNIKVSCIKCKKELSIWAFYNHIENGCNHSFSFKDKELCPFCKKMTIKSKFNRHLETCRKKISVESQKQTVLEN